MHKDILPNRTRRLLEACAEDRGFAPFVLVGGTALALNVGHRISEDLDFVTAEKRLDRRSIDGILRALAARGWTCRQFPNDDERLNFAESGLDLDDCHQDWSVGGVKLTFFVADGLTAPVIAEAGTDACGSIRVARPDVIFQMKALLLTRRATSRDIFDIWWFLEHGGKTVGDIVQAVARAKPSYPVDSVVNRLLLARLPGTDPGFQAVMKAPPDLTGLRAVIARHVDAYERNHVAFTARQGKLAFDRVAKNGADGLRQMPDAVAAETAEKAAWYATTSPDGAPGKAAVERALAEYRDTVPP